MERLSPEPFASYPLGGRILLGKIKGTNCRRGYGLRHQALTRQNTCGYCGYSLIDSYRDWLQMAYDHVVPVFICSAASIPIEWMDDLINRVLCCTACNGFKNIYKPVLPHDIPKSLEEFVMLRDYIFLERQKAVLKCHATEKAFYDGSPWKWNGGE